MIGHVVPHAVSRLRTARLARSGKPFLARGGPRGERCAGCRLVPSHCLCALRPQLATRAGVCLLMADIEPLKPSNTGWLVADVVVDTFAFGWEVLTNHYLQAKNQLPADVGDAAHQRLRALALPDLESGLVRNQNGDL